MKPTTGIVTGSGDCPRLDAVIRAVARTAANHGWETVGLLGGHDGLLEPVQVRPIEYHELDGLLLRGGTVLGTAKRGRFAAKTEHREAQRIPAATRDEAEASVEKLEIGALVRSEGDGSLSIAQQLHDHGIPIGEIPETIANDLAATFMTFGFDSSVARATDALDRLHTAAESHRRVVVLEVMGRYAGWIAMLAGIAGRAEIEDRTGKGTRVVVLGHL